MQLRNLWVVRGLFAGLLMSLVAGGAQATTMTLEQFAASGATVGGVTFSNVSVSIKKGLNKDLDRYLLVVSDTGIRMLGQNNRPGSITLRYDIAGASYAGVSGVLDVKRKVEGTGTVGVAGVRLALKDDGGEADSGSKSFAASSALRVTQTLRVKKASRFDFSASFSKASPPSVPEPGVALMLVTGLAGLGWLGRKR